jgi:hypothetical protein
MGMGIGGRAKQHPSAAATFKIKQNYQIYDLWCQQQTPGYQIEYDKILPAPMGNIIGTEPRK